MVVVSGLRPQRSEDESVAHPEEFGSAENRRVGHVIDRTRRLGLGALLLEMIGLTVLPTTSSACRRTSGLFHRFEGSSVRS